MTHVYSLGAWPGSRGTIADRRGCRGAAITEQVVHCWARAHDWRVPKHFDQSWQIVGDHHRDDPDHPFEPYGITVGHGLEWSRLVLQVRAALEGAAPDWMLDSAEALFDRATSDGWHADDAEGFVYTTDRGGTPVVRDRMHWVLAEAICAASALHRATGKQAYDPYYRTFWDHAREHWVGSNGSWQHQLDAQLRPSETVWSGRPDLYHSVHAVLRLQAGCRANGRRRRGPLSDSRRALRRGSRPPAPRSRPPASPPPPLRPPRPPRGPCGRP